MPLQFPTLSDSDDCVLLFVQKPLIPILGGLLSRMQHRIVWDSDNDYMLGSRAFAQMEAELMRNCMNDLILEIRRARGVAEIYEEVPEDERTTEMYRSLDDIVRRLNTIIFALSGGLDHGDNLLTILRGNVEADEDRNVMEALL